MPETLGATAWCLHPAGSPIAGRVWGFRAPPANCNLAIACRARLREGVETTTEKHSLLRRTAGRRLTWIMDKSGLVISRGSPRGSKKPGRALECRVSTAAKGAPDIGLNTEGQTRVDFLLLGASSPVSHVSPQHP